jgi:hypothetical protein
MTFRVEDLSVALLPERYEIEMADQCTQCTKCTKCTAKTGGPSDCTCPSGKDCACDNTGSGSSPTKKAEADLEFLHGQLDELLATAK